MTDRRPAAAPRPVPRAPARDRLWNRCLVLADDLTGAGDTAIALAGAGEDALVYLDDVPAAADMGAVAAAAVDLHTRDLPAPEAARRVAMAAARAPAGVDIYKKIDSTLRGHIGAELAALCGGLADRDGGRMTCIVAPAFPAMGRSLEGGVLHLHGKPVDAEALWGAGAGASRGDLAGELRAHGFACVSIHLADLRTGGEAELAARMAAALHGGGAGAASDKDSRRMALVCDAVTAEDLRRVIRAARMLAVRCLWVGSAGLAHALAEVRDSGRAKVMADKGAPCLIPSGRPRALAFVVGSFSAVAAEQVRRLAQAGNVTHVSMPIAELTGEISATTAASIENCLRAGRDVVLSIPRDDVRAELAARLSAGMARVAQAMLARAGALVCCGGDTSRALLQRIGARRLRVRRCAEPGATLAWCDVRPDMPLIMKAGAFGDADALIRLREELRSAPGVRNGPSSASDTPS